MNDEKEKSSFEKIMEQMNPDQVVPYSMTGSIKLGDFIEHKLFGIGRVIDYITPDKIIADFQEGQKILVCMLKEDENIY